MPYDELLKQRRLRPYQPRPLALFDQMRRKRHRLVYEVAGLVSQQEAEQALSFAKAFVEETRLLISGQPRLELSDK